MRMQALGEFASRLTGSPDLYEHTARRPVASINFVTAHDGFTLRDLVSYNEKHNEANGEGNNDGESNNQSWNCGVGVDEQQPPTGRPGGGPRAGRGSCPSTRPAAARRGDVDHAQPRVGRGHLVHDRAGRIVAAVVDGDHLQRRVILVQGRLQASANSAGFVLGRPPSATRSAAAGRRPGLVEQLHFRPAGERRVPVPEPGQWPGGNVRQNKQGVFDQARMHCGITPLGRGGDARRSLDQGAR